ncbi:ferric reductase-like transmembrane domain-containing protein [Edaphobacter paludis]|uniref:Ferric reductase-like transmembrane domain-containing protein n=1 Tax=Edaphobacter paludis TaxID=3035702 RepID=A0AAU7D548_9BACT
MKSSSRYWATRIKRHILLAASAAAGTALIYLATAPPDFRHRLSMSTAYASLLFLCTTLLLGPWNTLRRRPNPVSFDLRRDIAIWAGLLAILHTAVGLTVHLRGRMWMYFLKQRHPIKFQTGLFGSANDIGLLSALFFLVLLVISNDVSLRALGLQRWKSLQRWTYVAVGLAIVHGILFQLVEKRRLPWVLVFATLSIFMVVVQLAGVAYIRAQRRTDA